jgi:cation transport ATPase
LSLGVPFAGVLIGLFLYDHASRTVRLIGRNSLLIGFVVWVLMPLALVVLLSLLGALAAMDWLSNAFPSGS